MSGGGLVRMEIRGVEETRAALRTVGLELEKVFAASLVAGCFVISNAAKDKCRYRTGNARRSIHIGYERNDVTRVQLADNAPQPMSPGIVAAIANDLTSSSQVELLVGTEVWYTWNLEFIMGYPFLRPAFDENRKEVNAEVRRALQSALRKVTKRG